MDNYLSDDNKTLTLDWDNDYDKVVQMLEDWGEGWVQVEGTIYYLVE